MPPDFRFAVRMPRLITHGSRLGLVGTFCERVRLLGEKLGPVLVVLDRPRDDGFLMLLQGSLDPELEYAFDFRHESWAEADVPVRVNSLEGEAPFRYLRLREPPYDEAALAGWAQAATAAARRGRARLLLLQARGRADRPALR